jgi:hypothetical protein
MTESFKSESADESRLACGLPPGLNSGPGRVYITSLFYASSCEVSEA